MTEPIEMSFGVWIVVGPRNYVFDVRPDLAEERAIWGAYIGMPAVVIFNKAMQPLAIRIVAAC